MGKGKRDVMGNLLHAVGELLRQARFREIRRFSTRGFSDPYLACV